MFNSKYNPNSYIMRMRMEKLRYFLKDPEMIEKDCENKFECGFENIPEIEQEIPATNKA